MRRAPLAVVSLALAGALVAGCGDDDDPAEAASTTAESTTTTADDGSTTTAPGAEELTPFPQPDAPLTHGGETWAVVLAGAESFDDPSLDAAIRALAEVGYATGPTDCDLGATAALGLPDGYATVSAVGYSTEQLATQALTALEERDVEGAVVAQVTTYCLD